MNNRVNKVILVILICLGVSALVITCSVYFIQNHLSSEYNQKYNKLYSARSEILTTYLAFGSGEETQAAIDNFMKTIPPIADSHSNIVITDKEGKIIQKLNYDYLHQANSLIMAWNGYAIQFDPSNDKKYLFRVTGEENTYLNEDIENPWEYEKNVRVVGSTKLKQSQEQLASMIGSYGNITEVEAEVSIKCTGDKDNPIYVFWFHDVGLEDKISNYLGSSNYFLLNVLLATGLIMFLLYWLLAPVWVFLDARRRQIQPLPWALLVLLTNVVGLVVYWIVQTQNGKTPPASACPACGKPVKKAYPYCPWCAAPLVKACRACGKTLEPGWVACPWCGQRTDGHEPGT